MFGFCYPVAEYKLYKQYKLQDPPKKEKKEEKKEEPKQYRMFDQEAYHELYGVSDNAAHLHTAVQSCFIAFCLRLTASCHIARL